MDADLFEVRDNGTMVLRVSVHPGAGRTQVKGTHGDALKVSVAAPPDKGRANDAVAELLAESFGLAKSAVSIVSGETNRQKKFLLAGMEEEDARLKLERVLEDAERKPGAGNRKF
jgi:uncharacterized protein (TIGR00251 family)